MILNKYKNKKQRASFAFTAPLFAFATMAFLLLFYCLNVCLAEPVRRANGQITTTTSSPANTKLSFIGNASLWDKMSRKLNLFDSKNVHYHPQVKRYMREYSQQKATMRQMSQRAKPFLYYIVQRVEARGMPLELALLPMLESRFEPTARSPKGASGLWQMISSTGRIFGLKTTAYYDGRRDVAASTEAALNYLSRLHKQFNKDWMLALAAYNAGEGTVQRAIRKNRSAGKPTDFWSLSLPKETKAYVPKLIAITRLIKLSKEYDLDLTHIQNRPYFKEVQFDTAVDFHQLAKKNDTSVTELARLNPGYPLKKAPSQGTKKVLIPIG